MKISRDLAETATSVLSLGEGSSGMSRLIVVMLA